MTGFIESLPIFKGVVLLSSIPLYLAFSAGIVSFFSPCILPLIPGYISYLAGVSTAPGQVSINKSVVIARAVMFNLGFMLVFIMMGATGSYIGSSLLAYKPVFLKIGGLIIFLMGLHMTGLLKLQFLYRTYKLDNKLNIGGPLGALLLGVVFAAGWTPCVGPVLASILVLAGMAGTVAKGALLLGVFSLGLAVPFMLTAVFAGWLVEHLHKINKHLKYVSVVSGMVLMAVGLLLFFNLFPKLTAYLVF